MVVATTGGRRAGAIKDEVFVDSAPVSLTFKRSRGSKRAFDFDLLFDLAMFAPFAKIVRAES